MKTVRRWAVGVLVVVGLAMPSDGCGPFFAQAVFVQQTRPDGDYAKYAAGRIGVPQPGYRVRHLVIAYDWEMGRGLSAGEQAQAVALDKELYSPTGTEDDTGAGPGLKAWLAARQGAGVPGGPQAVAAKPGQPWTGRTAEQSLSSGRAVPGESYETFANCLDGAFAAAAATLGARRAAHGGEPAFADWVRGQDAVFANCDGGADQAPAAVGAGAPVWLTEDRAYQRAAAKFYQEDYDGAIAGMKAVASDAGSPWRATARLVEARAMIRRATVGQGSEVPALLKVGSDAPYSAEVAKAGEAYTAELAKQRPRRMAEAGAALEAILADPGMRPFHVDAAGLLDYVMLRWKPVEQAQVLETRLTEATRPQTPGVFRQGLIDLRYLMASPDGAEDGAGRLPAGGVEPNGLVAWMQTMGKIGPKGTADSLFVTKAEMASAAGQMESGRQRAMDGWRSTRSVPWMLAAAQTAQTGTAEAQELAAAAAKVAAHSTAGVGAGMGAEVAARYFALRLGGDEVATRSEVERLLPGYETGQSRSTVNLMVRLRQKSSPTLAAFLEDAGTIPAGVLVDEEDPEAPGTEAQPSGLCHVTSPAGQTRLFDHEAATVLNLRMPLGMLAEAGTSAALAANLRYQVVQSAWTRAVLLDQPEVARRMSPLLAGCYPAWTPWLEKYDGATSAEERKVTGLLALMRFASTEPVVRDGEPRPEGFATYSEYRDNWWDGSAPGGAAVNADGTKSGTGVDRPKFFGVLAASRTEVPDPPFLKATDRAAVDSEVAALAKIPCASDYFATEALAWQRAHAGDPRTADVLGFAERVVRNGCRTDATKELNHQLFTVVQGQYSKSEWAKKYTSWE